MERVMVSEKAAGARAAVDPADPANAAADFPEADAEPPRRLLLLLLLLAAPRRLLLLLDEEAVEEEEEEEEEEAATIFSSASCLNLRLSQLLNQRVDNSPCRMCRPYNGRVLEIDRTLCKHMGKERPEW
jgi:hypothetical protein